VKVKKIINKIKAISLAGLLMVCAMPIASLAAETVNVELTVNVETNGEGHDKNEEFTIELKDSNGTLLESKEVKEGETTLAFDKMVYSSPGTHHYTISEKQGNTEGYTYDNKNVYNVTVHVVADDNGKLGYSVTLNKLGTDTKSGRISFVNTYTKTKETSENPSEPESSSEPESQSTPESPSEPESQSTPESSSEPENSPSSESSSEPESSSTPETPTQPATVPVVPTPTPTPQPSTIPATESPNRPSNYPRIEREEIPTIPVYEELVADTSNPEYVNLAPDPVPLVSLTSLDDEDTPKAVLIADEDVPLAVMTGDAFNMILWIALLAVSGIVIVLIFASKLKARKNNK
jgi:pilin isopeptide linkage protein